MLRIRLCAGKGRGVFAQRHIKEGETIEQAPVLIIPACQWEDIEKTVLFDYCFSFGKDETDAAIALGYGSLMNHSYSPNASYIKRTEEMVIEFVALRDILEGEEICVNYNGSPKDQSAVWFEVID
jgi:uncharacterized protein